MTTVYLVRHSEPFKVHKGIEEISESIFLSNLKTPLSINGEKLAEKISINGEFADLDVVWASDYVRAMSTAKYFANRNNLKVNISDKLGERKHGICNWDELPSDFEICQFQNENYKIGDGESQKETRERFFEKLNQLLEFYKGKRILIVSHSTAIAFLLSKWCEINYNGPYKFNGKVFFDGKWNYCETFKLNFDEKQNLVDIQRLSLNS